MASTDFNDLIEAVIILLAIISEHKFYSSPMLAKITNISTCNNLVAQSAGLVSYSFFPSLHVQGYVVENVQVEDDQEEETEGEEEKPEEVVEEEEGEEKEVDGEEGEGEEGRKEEVDGEEEEGEKEGEKREVQTPSVGSAEKIQVIVEVH